ncbi:MAG: hypothetical protein DWH80_10705 [Planctomycetota bacterium]|nr:MAG: hypothetical protein DWH80_10705 [Planctomycetota bacterium]
MLCFLFFRRFSLLCATGFFGIVLSNWTHDATAADASKTILASGSSSRTAKREAVEAIPLHRLTIAHREAVNECVRSTTLYRRLPVQTVACHPDLLEFSLHHPDSIVDIWRVLNISKLSLDSLGPDQWRFADGYGTVGTFQLIYQEKGLLLFLGRGAYNGSLAPKVLSGTCMLLVRHQPLQGEVGAVHKESLQIDTFLNMDGAGLEFVTRTLQPLIVLSASHNIHEISLFISALSEAARKNPAGVAALANQLDRVNAVERERLAHIARTIGGDERQARLSLDEVTVNRMNFELASRWIPADELEKQGPSPMR